MRPDQQDYQGTAVTVDVAKKLDVPKLFILVNKAPSNLDFEEVRARVEQTYEAKVGAILPHSDEMMMLASSGLFTIHYPDNVVTKGLRNLVDLLKS
jgi:septum site-determining protein MinD